ncbi:MAG: chemotaxis protein CheB [Planctomycetota bacterium]
MNQRSVDRGDEVIVPLVGIGASAGGLQSIENLFGKMPSDTGMAFIVIQHLSPDFKSLMPEILSRHTPMPVKVVEQGATLDANSVYLIPPGKEIRCVGHQVEVTDFQTSLHKPIDTFFKSLAANEGVPISGIVLSGSGSDGAEGLEAIHRVGGWTMAESTLTAQFDGMPIAAERTGCVDAILTPAEMPAALLRNMNAVPRQTPGAPQEVDLTGVRLIFSLLENRYDLHFDDYKPATIARRIERRQILGRFENVFAYAEHLSKDEQELDELFHDLLIGVTKFFRDAKAFDVLEEQLEIDIARLPPGETYRIWVAGCASGEEAYSIAMIALDILHRLGRKPVLKVFATDVHQRILEQAATGIFDADALEFVSIERQQKYFEQLDTGRFRVVSALRQNLIFAGHNLIQDPPFTNIHLVSCRNVLIYFQGAAQTTSLASLHFSLVPDGVLFLGASESLGEMRSEFSVVNGTWRIFRKSRDRRDLVTRVNYAREATVRPIRPAISALNGDQPAAVSVRTLMDVYEAVIQTKIPCGLLLDHNQGVLHAFGDTSKILKWGPGRFTGKIVDFLEPPARTTIAAALIRAQKSPGTNFTVEGLRLYADSETHFDVGVMALQMASNLGWILQFIPVDREPAPAVRVTPTDPDSYELLESELSFTKESLSASIEELETSNEELQATNEEMIASNEELQSTNEELHSVNEELHSVNIEHQRKIEELEEITVDLETLMATSEVGTVFLGPDLRIRKFTKAVTRYFNLVEYDVGRKLSDFTNRLGLPELEAILSETLKAGKVYSAFRTDDFGQSVMVKVVPCRTGGAISGVVLNVMATTPETHERGAISYGTLGFWDWPDTDEDEMVWSPSMFGMLGLDPEAATASFSTLTSLAHPDDLGQLADLARTRTDRVRVRLKAAEGRFERYEFQNATRCPEEGSPSGLTGMLLTSDVSSKLDGGHRGRLETLEQVTTDLQDFVYAVSHDLQAPLRHIDQAVQRVRDIAAKGSDPTDVSKDETSPELALALDQASARTQRLADMLQGLLAFSQVNTRSVTFAECALEEVIDSVLEEFSDPISAAGVHLERVPLPSVVGDAAQLRMVFWHLLDNSLKYSEATHPIIRIGLEDSPHHHVITFSDNGIGVEIRHLRDVFTIFRRLRTMKEVPGLGVGLTLCKRIVERHGGRIWLESGQEGGCKFFLRLPRM